MQACLYQARINLGRTAPNPSVGAVIADANTGEIIGSGVTAIGGRPHAESMALAAAGARTKGAVMIVTLEPCSHQGVTPPCVDAIVQSVIAAVVYGSADPDPRVAGRGIAKLQASGIAVVRGAFATDCDWLNLGHTLRVSRSRPFVRLKLAVDAGGRIAKGDGAPVWVTGEEARAQAHLLRARADAILIGSGTLFADNPRLDCRLPGLEVASPVRVILAGRNPIASHARIFENGAPVWIVSSNERRPAVLPAFGERIEVEADDRGRPDIGTTLHALAARGITRLLVEGGPTIAKAFLDRDLVDEAIVMQGAVPVPKGEIMLPFVDAGLERLVSSAHLSHHRDYKAGDDTISVYRSRQYWRE